MKRFIIMLVIFGAAGLVIGYLIFGRSGGSYVSIQSLFSPSGGFFDRLRDSVRGIPEIRRNVLIAGGVGAVLGVVFTAVRR